MLALWQPEAEGVAFSANTADIALRVADVEASRERLSAQGVDFLGETVPARDGISPVSRSSSLPGTVVNGRPLLRSERPGRLPAGSRSGRPASVRNAAGQTFAIADASEQELTSIETLAARPVRA